MSLTPQASGLRSQVASPTSPVPWLIAFVALLAYANALQNGFAFDDQGILPHHRVIQHAEPLWRAFTTPYWPNGAGQYRPLVIASFALESWAWGLNPVGFHALNVLWHALASVLVYFVARRWLSHAGSAIAALVFAVHPLHVEAVANVVGRAELMAACGVLAMLVLHQRRSPWAIAAFAFALLSKEHALLAPLLVFGADLATRAPRPRDGETRRADDRGLPVGRLYGSYALVALVWGAALIALFHNQPFASVDPFWTSMNAPARWLTVLGLVPVWARLWFVPAELSADYSPRVTVGWPDNVSLVLLGAAIVLLAFAVALASRHRDRAVTVAIAWMAITMLPVANLIVPTGVIVAERTMYLSSVGAVLLFGVAAERLGRWRPSAAIAMTMVICGAFAVRTWTRTPVWKSNRDLFISTVASHPEASWTHVMLARIFAGNGGIPQALAEYRRAILLFDRNPISWSEAIYTAAKHNDFALADSLVAEARLRFQADYLVALAHANIALAQNRFSEGLRAARAAAVIAPDSAAAKLAVATAWAGLAEPDSARLWYARIPRTHPLRVRADSGVTALIGR